MYSVVMATMLAAGSTTPAWHHHRCYSSCHSCYGYSSCYCSSCYSSCYSYRSHCHGCNAYYGCSSCHCSCYSGYSGYSGYAGYYCSGCHSSCTTVYYSSCNVCSTSAPRVIEVPAKKGEKVDPPKRPEEEVSIRTQVKSRVTVLVPANARLWVDNVECPLTSAVRSFDTPALNDNQKYVYNLRMEVVRDGQTVVQTQRAIITPGQPVQVDFNAAAQVTASR